MQKSGFSNNITKPLLRELCKEYNITWEKERNFIFQRLPVLFNYYILSPPRKFAKVGFIQESFSHAGLIESIKFVFVGFIGVGSI